MLTYLSLFSGIGGLDLAVEALGFTCVGQVEYDPACTRVLERWWPDVPRWGDVTEFGVDAFAYAERGEVDAAATGGLHAESAVPSDVAATYAERQPVRVADGGADTDTAGQGTVQTQQRQRVRADDRDGTNDVDLIIGGFPCQPVSTAGRRKAQDDHRWLWPEFARVIRELGPRWVLVENVPGLLGAGDPPGSALAEILRDLAEARFDARWTSLRASDVGACHRRERIFLLANRSRDERGNGRQALRRPRIGVEPAGLQPGGTGGRVAPDPEDSDRRFGEASGTQGEGIRRRGSGSEPAFPWGAYGPAIERWERVLNRCAPHPVDDKGRLAPGFVEWMMGFPAGWTDGSTRTQALKQLGNAVVPAQGAAGLRALSEET